LAAIRFGPAYATRADIRRTLADIMSQRYAVDFI